MVAESPITGCVAHAAKTKQDHTTETSGLYPLDCDAHRVELGASELALAMRGACTFSLQVSWMVA